DARQSPGIPRSILLTILLQPCYLYAGAIDGQSLAAIGRILTIARGWLFVYAPLILSPFPGWISRSHPVQAGSRPVMATRRSAGDSEPVSTGSANAPL